MKQKVDVLRDISTHIVMVAQVIERVGCSPGDC